MDRLPVELTTNILSRLPFKCTARSKCVSQLWQSILSDPSFPKLQLSQHSNMEPDLVFFHNVDTLHPAIFYIQLPINDNELVKPFRTTGPDFVTETFYSCPYSLGAANGFMCISEINALNISLLPRNPIYVFNPLTQETAELPHFTVPERDVPDFVEKGKKIDKCVSGFGYDDASNEFMLVLVLFAARDYHNQIFNTEVQILTLGSPTWKKINVPKCLRRAYVRVSPPAVNHHLHWVTIDQSSAFDGPLIVSYHLSLEEFKFLATPGANLLLELPYERYTVGVLGDRLSLAESSSSRTLIWVMNKYNCKESWVKQFVIEHDSVRQPELNCDFVELLKVCNNGELLLLCSDMYLVSYDSATGKCKVVEIEGTVKKDKPCLSAHLLVGRFISLRSAFGMDSSAKKLTRKEKVDRLKASVWDIIGLRRNRK